MLQSSAGHGDPCRYVDGEMGEVGPQRQIRTVAWQQGQKCVREARHPHSLRHIHSSCVFNQLPEEAEPHQRTQVAGPAIR